MGQKNVRIFNSVADPECLSRIPDTDFYPSRIPDPKTATKERGEKKFSCHPFFYSNNFNKVVNYFMFEMLKKKFGPIFKELFNLLLKKTFTKLSKIWLWDPGSGKNLFRIPGSKRHRIPDPDPQH
jgi:hypothetical protein